MPFIPKFLPRGSSSSQNSATAAENDEHARTAANGALHTLNSDNGGSITSTPNTNTNTNTNAPNSVHLVSCTQQTDGVGQEMESNATRQSQKKQNTEDDSSGAWWNLLSNKGSFDSSSIAVTTTPTVKGLLGETASNYIRKERMLQKKAFNRAALKVSSSCCAFSLASFFSEKAMTPAKSL